MGRFNVKGNEIFKVDATAFGVSKSAQGYTLQYSSDGVNFTSYIEETPANENLQVVGCASGEYWKLSGNTDTVVINY